MPKRLVGGPCDGTPIISTAPPTLECKGVTYYMGGDGNYYTRLGRDTADWRLDTKQVGRAWNRITHVLGVESGQAFKRTAKARARIKRIVK